MLPSSIDGEARFDMIEMNLEYLLFRSRVGTHSYSSRNSCQIRDRASLRIDAASVSELDA